MTVDEACILGIPRWTEEVTFSGPGGSPTTVEADYPASNLGILPLARLLRFTDPEAGTTRIFGTLSSARPAQLFALVGHNISVTGQDKLTVYSDAAWSTVADTLDWADTWPTVYPQGATPWWQGGFWNGKYTADERRGITPVRPRRLTAPKVMQSFLWEIDDAAGNEDGYVQVAMVEVALGWQATVSFGLDDRQGFRFRSRVVEAEGGVDWIDRRAKPRVFEGALKFLSADEALARGWELQRQMDLDQPFLWWPRPSKPLHWLRETWLARLEDPGLLQWAGPGRMTVPLKLKEVF